MISKALLLCAGMGSRLRPLTYTTAKHILPVANKPILFSTIEMLQRAGIDEIGIVVASNKDDLMKGVGDGSRWGICITYIDQKTPLGTAHAVKVAEEWAASDPFVMILGDIVVENGIDALLTTYTAYKPDGVVVLHHTDRPKQFGIAEIRDDRIVGLEEKPEHPKSNLAVAGIYVFTESIFRAIDSVKPSPRGELELPDAIRTLIDDGKRVDPFMLEGWWKDTGRPEDIIDLNQLLLDQLASSRVDGTVDSESSIVGHVVIGESARIERSTIRGPVVIDSGAVIRDAYIGPHTSIGADVTVENAEVENSVILEHTTISNISTRITSSLIGKSVRVTGGNEESRLQRFVLGDTCQLTLP